MRIQVKKQIKYQRSRGCGTQEAAKPQVLLLASVASMIDQFNMPNIRLLLTMGYEVHVACNFKEGNTCDDRRIRKLKKALYDLHVPWHQWDCPRKLSSPAKCLWAYRQVYQLLKQYHFLWIHCHSPVGGALARVAAHRRRIRVIYTAHGFHFYQGAPWQNWVFYYPVELFLSCWTDILITINREDDCFARRWLKAKKVCYIPGIGIDTGYFQKRPQITREQLCQTYHVPECAKILLSVGELSHRKNHKAVLEALAKLNRQDVYYFICGQGELRVELLEYAKKLDVLSYVRMPGFLEHIATFYQNADIFVFPSLQEGLPVALMEAMAAGMPCIVSDIRGNRELIDQQGGMRFLTKQPWQLVCALAKMLDDATLRQMCGSYNQEKIRAYDMTAVLARTEKIYKKMEESRWQKQKEYYMC